MRNESNWAGILISDASDNVIGPNNVISGVTIGIFITENFGTESVVTQNNKITGNFIGTKADGSGAVANLEEGIRIENGAKNNIVGPNNIISGNKAPGVRIIGTGTEGNKIIGNLIGTDKSGKNPVPNGDGIAIEDGASKNYIGGSAPGLGNLIAFNSNVGIWLNSDSYVQGNEISGHSQDGIFIVGSKNTIGGSEPGSRNFLHGNNNGIRTSHNADQNSIEGNYLGTDKKGESDQTNGYNGVALSSSYNLVKNNLISGYEHHGIYIQRWNTERPLPIGNRLEGNIIGMNASETAAIPNQHGISINTAIGTIIYKNIIAGNQNDGIGISGQFFTEDDDYHYSVNNLISQNSIYNNGQLGIDLDLDGVTYNDAESIPNEVNGGWDHDTDAGGNNHQNFPVIDSIMFDLGSKTIYVEGYLKSNAYTQYTLEFFASK